MMKSDKAVCTNDTTMEDLGRALTYEAIFTTLIENKVLAIKRDCEERKRAKRQKRKSFGRILFSKKIFGSSGGRGVPTSPEDVEKGSQAGEFAGNVTSQLADCHIHDETTSKASSRRHHQQEAIANDIEEVSQAAVSLRRARNAGKAPQSQLYQEDDSIASNAYNESLSLSEKNGGASSLVGGVRNLVVEVLTHHHDVRCTYDDEGSILGPTTSIPLTDDATVGQNFDAISLGSPSNPIDEHNTSTMADDSLTSIRDSIESLSFPSSRCTVSVSGFGADAVCPEITVNPSCLESASLIFDKSRAKRLRILEAKSISAQNSPILPRHIKPSLTTRTPCLSQTQSRVTTRQQEKTDRQHLHHQVSFSNGTPEERPAHTDAAMKPFSRQNTSEDSANLTVSTLLNEGEEAHTGHDLGRKSKSTSLLVISHKSSQDNLKKQPLSSRLDSNNRSSVNQPLAPRGESYIAYTTTSNYFPVITMTSTSAAAAAAAAASTTSAASASNGGGGGSSVYATPTDEFVPAPSAIVPSATLPSDTAKLHRMTSTSTGSSVAPTGCCATKSRDKEKRFKPSWPSGQSGSDDEYRKRKRKYKRHHRCSDPVLVYPSASGLQHCILSMPPNQPIQFHYNEDFVYDMTLQVESDKNDDLQEIVPSSRNRKHRHHKHKKRHRHKKPKILVHDLDTRMVKVIDPDDLPQRARWTIIATAFLLLLMCLMLVGITLRMAPIIDDMVCRGVKRISYVLCNPRSRVFVGFLCEMRTSGNFIKVSVFQFGERV